VHPHNLLAITFQTNVTSFINSCIFILGLWKVHTINGFPT